jgi:hypothetical protein
VWNTAALIEVVDAALNFIQLPAFRLNEGGDGLSGMKGLGPPSSLDSECLEALVRVDIEPRWTLQNRPLIDTSKPATTDVTAETSQW